MNSNQNIENMEDFPDETGLGDATSIDDFIKQLEAREKDLQISSDLVIEVGESEFDDKNVPEFLAAELPAAKEAPHAKNFAVVPALDQKKYAEIENELAQLKTQLSKMEAERAEIFENSRRRQKDFENYKSRTERERRETFVNQVSNLATQILPVLDNMNRALDFAVHVPDDRASEFRQFFDGIILVNQQLTEVLAEMGVSQIAAVGERFDPHFHEAVAIEETENFAPQTISAELRRGYRIGDRVIRASMVKVATPLKAKAASVAEDAGEKRDNEGQIESLRSSDDLSSGEGEAANF